LGTGDEDAEPFDATIGDVNRASGAERVDAASDEKHVDGERPPP
jgi:hypothetical protein